MALDAGFHLAGVATARQPEKSSLLSEWLGRHFHGTMQWMQRHADKRMDLQQFYPGTQSVICVAHNYYTPHQHSAEKDTGRISRYAWGKDYHRVMKKKLKGLVSAIKKIEPQFDGRICVDTAPIMDKLWAERAGLGWQGKHTNLINREIGSWFFLGEIVTTYRLQPDQPVEDFCGSCTACIDACPTQAIIAPYVLDSRKCISYLTIEMWNEPIDPQLAVKMDNWIFGCDICQDVCPWNRFATETTEEAYRPDPRNITPKLSDLAKLGESEYKRRFKHSPVSRPGWRNFLRNITAVKNNR